MGDRGNIVIRSSKSNRDDVWLYTHWSGSEIKATAKRGLAKAQPRWGDSSYLARIVFNELQGDDRGETGFGISSSITDNEHPILVIDDAEQKVSFIEEAALKDGRIPDNYKPKKATSFADFIK